MIIPNDFARPFLPEKWREKILFAEYVLEKRIKINNLQYFSCAGLVLGTALLAIIMAAAVIGDARVYIESLCYSAAVTVFSGITNMMAGRLIYKVDAEIMRMTLSHEND